MTNTVTLADEIVGMTKGMDLRYDRSIEESMLLDIVLKARIAQKLQASQTEPTRDVARGACAMANRPSCESYPNCTCGRAVGVVSQSTAYNEALKAPTGCGCLFGAAGEHYPSCAFHPDHPNRPGSLQNRRAES